MFESWSLAARSDPAPSWTRMRKAGAGCEVPPGGSSYCRRRPTSLPVVAKGTTTLPVEGEKMTSPGWAWNSEKSFWSRVLMWVPDQVSISEISVLK